MTQHMKRKVLLFPILAPALLAACVSQSRYDDLQAQYRQLQQQNATLTAQVAADKTQICRPSGAIKYTVNSVLLFPAGGFEMRERRKQIIANIATNLRPTQHNKGQETDCPDNKPGSVPLAPERSNANQHPAQA